MNKIKGFSRKILFVSVLMLCLFAVTVEVQAEIGLNLDGATGSAVVPNAFVVPSEPSSNLSHQWKGLGTPKIGFHYVNLDSNDLTAYHVTKGFVNRFEFGYTRQVMDSTLDMHILHGKFQFLEHNFKDNKWIPALALGAMHRNIEGDIPGSNYGNDYYLSATKIIPIEIGNVISFKFAPTAGLISTKAIANGLFGFSTKRSTGFQGIFEIITDKVVFGVDYKTQPEIDDWTVYFLRYNVQPNFQVDFALGDLGEGLHNQFIVGVSYRF